MVTKPKQSDGNFPERTPPKAYIPCAAWTMEPCFFRSSFALQISNNATSPTVAIVELVRPLEDFNELIDLKAKTGITWS